MMLSPEEMRATVKHTAEWAVHEIPQGTHFLIPSYQRGYRWTESEVTTLLNDLATFADSDEKKYCLQPLVTQTKEDGRILVVDGQQRLTTIAIIFHALGCKAPWEMEYTAEGTMANERGPFLCELLTTPGKHINDHFRMDALATAKKWMDEDSDRKERLSKVLTGNGQSVVFLRHELTQEDGHAAFARLNAGKTPLTSAELIRACYMEAGNGLEDTAKVDIAKEWDLIESAMADQGFWAIWDNNVLNAEHMRMDFLFSLVLSIDLDKVRHNPLALYNAFEKVEKKPAALKEKWEEQLRCWWWMQSCYEDEQIYHRLGWVLYFTEKKPHTLYNTYRSEYKVEEKTGKITGCGCRMDVFKKALLQIINERAPDLATLTYDSDRNELLGALVLLNLLEAEHRHIRFRWDLYHKTSWDVEHIASQTDNALEKKDERKEWLDLTTAEMTPNEKQALEKLPTFQEKWKYVWETFGRTDDTLSEAEKNGVGNLVLLDSNTNRSYKNNIFPAKRRRILEEDANIYIPPATEAAFSKFYTPQAAQMRYWGQMDADAYLKEMTKRFETFKNEAKGVEQ